MTVVKQQELDGNGNLLVSSTDNEKEEFGKEANEYV